MLDNNHKSDELEHSNNFINRIQIIPSFLNIIIVSLLLYILVDNSVYWDLINMEFQRIFLLSIDFVLFIIILGLIVGIYCITYLILSFRSPEFSQIPLISVLPVLFTAILEVFLFTLLVQNDLASVYQIYTLVGAPIDRILFFVLFGIFLFMIYLLIYKLPLLWKFYTAQNGESSRISPNNSSQNGPSEVKNASKKKGLQIFEKRKRPRFTLILITTWFIIFTPLLFFLTFQHPRLIFWELYFSLFDWNAFFVYIHIPMFLVSIVSLFALIRKKGQTDGSDNAFLKQKINRILVVLLIASLLLQIISLLILGLQQSANLVLYNPLFFLTLSLFLALFGQYLYSKKFTAFLGKLKTLKERKTRNSHNSLSKNRPRLLKLLIIILPISWICFLQPMFILMPRIIPDTSNVEYVKNSYEDLTLTQKTLFDDFLISEIPDGSNMSAYLTDTLGTRTAVRVASGLLFRNYAGDVENATKILEWLLPLQNTNPSESSYGIWKTSLENDRDDENWREFIGCELILILERHEDKLSSKLVSDIEESLLHAATGAKNRDVMPSYSNIAIMSAFLMTYVGITLEKPEIEDAGLLKAWQVYILFSRHDTFSEFNSPTYDGVTMMGLAFWRDLGPCEEMKVMGSEMEVKLWHEIADFYHPGFKNMVGPFFRSYGMDLMKYNTIASIWIALAIDDLNNAPLPLTNGESYFEISNIFPAVQLGHCKIDSVIEKLTSFEKSRFIEKLVPSSLDYISKEYKVTAWIDEDLMMGGVEGLNIYYKTTEQIKVGTLYWNSSIDDSLSWLMVPCENGQNVKVSEKQMEIWRDDNVDSVKFFINGKNLNTTLLEEKDWKLPGISIKSSTDPSSLTVKIVDAEDFGTDYAVHGDLDTVMQVKCDTSLIKLTVS